MTRVQSIRQRWEQWFGKEWPHTDEYLRELFAEAKVMHGLGSKSKKVPRYVDNTCLDLMTADKD